MNDGDPTLKRKPTSSPVDVIDLDDDNKTPDCCRQARKKQRASCCNESCATRDDLQQAALQPASKFVARHFGDRDGAGRGGPAKWVCDACFELAVEHNELMHRALEGGETLLALEVPRPNDPVFDLDSDEEDSAPIILPASTPHISMTTVMLVSRIVRRVASECGLNRQLAASTAHVEGRAGRLEAAAAGVGEEWASIGRRLEAMWEGTYAPFRPRYQSEGEIDIDDSDVSSHINGAQVGNCRSQRSSSTDDHADKDDEIIFLDEVVTLDDDLPILVGAPISLDPSAPWDPPTPDAPAAVADRGPTPPDETIPDPLAVPEPSWDGSSTADGPNGGCLVGIDSRGSRLNGVTVVTDGDGTNGNAADAVPGEGDWNGLDAVLIECVTSLAAPDVAPVLTPVSVTVSAPVTVSFITPVAVPVSASVAVPVSAPVAVPVSAPVSAPVVAPVTAGFPSPFDLLLSSGFPATSPSKRKVKPVADKKVKPVADKKVLPEEEPVVVKTEATKSDSSSQPSEPLSQTDAPPPPPDDVVAVEVVGSVRQGPPPAELPPAAGDAAGPRHPRQPPPGVGDRVYAMRGDLLVEWFQGEVAKVVPAPSSSGGQTEQTPSYQYMVRFMLPHRKGCYSKCVTGRQVAYALPARYRFSVGSRVIAVFRDEEEGEGVERYYAGVVAEPPKSENNFRYLIFFDDGYTQYVTHAKVRAVAERSPLVCRDVHEDVRSFIREYMERYPERPMLKLAPGQVVKTEFNGKWQLATVNALDNSLCQMRFHAVSRVEWLYRGSTRLGPLYDALLDSRRGGNVARRSATRVNTQQSAPFVQYNNDQDEETNSATPVSDGTAPAAAPPPAAPLPPPSPEASSYPRRSVAKKSTAPRPPPPPQLAAPAQEPEGEGKPAAPTAPAAPPGGVTPGGCVSFGTYNLSAAPQGRRYTPHDCDPSCVAQHPYRAETMKHVAPMAVPLLLAWRRCLNVYDVKHSLVSYTAPCGRRLRDADELSSYLAVVRSPLGVDLFAFDPFLSCLAEFDAGPGCTHIDDLSNGAENVAVPCVNSVDLDLPPLVRYTTGREPVAGVQLCLDPEFLVGCDCTDGCRDKDNCPCWQLTFAGTAFGSSGVIDNTIGYTHKRLMEPVYTGIYECNSRCKCSSTCSNRVVQNPLRSKLQVFKTADRGWGLRTLNDVPKGAFICVYAGSILLEQQANEPGHGDEYLAELDYIEVVEAMKEGYEEDVKAVFGDEVIDPSPPSSLARSGARGNPPADDAGEDMRDGRVNSRRGRNRDRRVTDKRKADKEKKGTGNYNTRNKTRKPQRFTLTPTPRAPCTQVRRSARAYLDDTVYLMDARLTGNVGRYFNHSCSANVFVQSVFVDSHDLRFPLPSFFALQPLKAGEELTWDYNYKVGSVTGKVLLCRCGAANCRLRLL